MAALDPSIASRFDLVFSDMDGTFLADDKSISPENLAALDALLQEGIGFVPCSGRVISGIPRVLLDHPATRYAVCSSGAAIYRIDHPSDASHTAEMVSATSIPHEDALRLYESLQGIEMQFDVFADGVAYVSRELFEHLPEFGLDEGMLAYVRSNRRVVDATVPEIIRSCRAIERINMYYKDLDGRRAMERAIDRIDCLYHQTSFTINVEACLKGVDKARGVTWVCAHEHIPRDRVIAFGDAGNDMAMFSACGCGVAMANATEPCKAAADVVSAVGNNGSGVAYVLTEGLR